MRLADPFREVGLHGRELAPVPDEGAGVQPAPVIEGDGHDGHVGGGLVAVDHGRQDIFLAVPFFDPVQSPAEVGVLVLAAHGVQRARAAADEVFQPVDCVGPDLLRCTGTPGIENPAAVLGSGKNGVVADAGRICVWGLTFPEGVLEAGPHVAEVLHLGAAQDREAPAAPSFLSPTGRPSQPERIVVVIHRRGPKWLNVYSLDILTNVVRPARRGGDTFNPFGPRPPCP